jgi:hypothetical protein
MSDGPQGTETEPFMDVLEQAVRDVIKNRKAKPSEKLQAATVGAKLEMIRHKISGSDEKGFFE